MSDLDKQINDVLKEDSYLASEIEAVTICQAQNNNEYHNRFRGIFGGDE